MHLPRRQLLVYLAVGLVVLAIGARFLFSHSSTPDAAGVPLAGLASASPGAGADPAAGPAGAAPGTSPSPSSAAAIVVDVVGAVARPGVYTLQTGARVCDAVDMAGGATANAQLAAVNMAAKLVDGQQIAIPEKGQTGRAGASAQAAGGPGQDGSGSTQPGAAGSSAAGAPVNLNTATLEQLDTLQGVGPSTAQKIVDYREANGGFKSIEELNNVAGIGEVRFQSLKDQVTV